MVHTAPVLPVNADLQLAVLVEGGAHIQHIRDKALGDGDRVGARRLLLP